MGWSVFDSIFSRESSMPKPLFSPGLFCSLKQCCFDFSSGSQGSNFLDWKEVETSFPATARCQAVLTCMYALCLPADTFLASLSSGCPQCSWQQSNAKEHSWAKEVGEGSTTIFLGREHLKEGRMLGLA